MTECRRRALPDFEKSVHNPGLVFQKWLREHEEGAKTEAPKLLSALKNSPANNAYRSAFDRWAESLTALGASTAVGECVTPLALGLGNESPLEVGLTFNHTYGMPVIPGMAVKGLARKSARAAKIDESCLEALVGTTSAAGCVTFFDAWYEPNSAEGKPFHRDVVTVHHPKYYSSKGKKPPTDFDDPTTVPFLIVRPGAKFLFAFLAPDAAWATFVRCALSWALENLGIGSKVNAGYGRIQLEQEHASMQRNVPKEVEATTWPNVMVAYDPGQGTLRATRSGDKAFADTKTNEGLISGLSEGIQNILRGKAGQARRPILADIDVTPAGGRNWRIVAIRPKEVDQ